MTILFFGNSLNVKKGNWLSYKNAKLGQLVSKFLGAFCLIISSGNSTSMP